MRIINLSAAAGRRIAPRKAAGGLSADHHPITQQIENSLRSSPISFAGERNNNTHIHQKRKGSPPPG